MMEVFIIHGDKLNRMHAESKTSIQSYILGDTKFMREAH